MYEGKWQAFIRGLLINPRGHFSEPMPELLELAIELLQPLIPGVEVTAGPHPGVVVDPNKFTKIEKATSVRKYYFRGADFGVVVMDVKLSQAVTSPMSGICSRCASGWTRPCLIQS